MPDLFHVALLATNALFLSLSVAVFARTRREGKESGDVAARWAEHAKASADDAAMSADIAVRQASRAAREATRAINANAKAPATDATDAAAEEAADVIPFHRPGSAPKYGIIGPGVPLFYPSVPTGPRLADLDTDRPA